MTRVEYSKDAVMKIGKCGSNLNIRGGRPWYLVLEIHFSCSKHNCIINRKRKTRLHSITFFTFNSLRFLITSPQKTYSHSQRRQRCLTTASHSITTQNTYQAPSLRMFDCKQVYTNQFVVYVSGDVFCGHVLLVIQVCFLHPPTSP